MMSKSSPPNPSQRRCPNCGARVAGAAESCFMCGHNLKGTKSQRRVSWMDAALVLIVLVVITVWWRSAARPAALAPTPTLPIPAQLILPTPLPTDTPTPEPSPTVTPIPAPTPFMHRVQSGETLLAIAGQYSVTVEDLQRANNLTDALIRVGDDLFIPHSGAPAASSPGAGEGAGTVASVFTYQVRSGDTVVSIAIRFGTTVEAILAANNMRPTDFIQPNQTLLVPVGELPREVLEVSVPTPAPGQPNGIAPQPAVYAAPRLLGPADREVLATGEAALFRWLSVDILQPNEWYVLRIWSADGAYPDPTPVWTKATSHRLTLSFPVDSGAPAQFRWQISVVRVLPGPDNSRQLQAASQPSDIRNLTWR